MLLYRRRHKLHLTGIGGHDARATYGFLYRGYAPKRFYWEIMIMLRKTAMVMVATFGLRATVQTQGMLALLVLMLALTCHLIYRPYDEPSLDHLEFFGLAAATVTLYFGMFFFTDDVVFAPWWGFVVTFTIMTVNSIFLAYFFLSLYAAFREESNTIKRLTTTCRVGIRTCRDTCLSRVVRNATIFVNVLPLCWRHAELWVEDRVRASRHKKLPRNKGERDSMLLTATKILTAFGSI